MVKLESTMIETLRTVALEVSKNYGCGVKIEIDAINNDAIKNCNIWVRMKIE